MWYLLVFVVALILGGIIGYLVAALQYIAAQSEDTTP